MDRVAAITEATRNGTTFGAPFRHIDSVRAGDLITFQLKDGTYVLPTVVDHGYLEIGKHRLEFRRAGK